MILKQLKGTIKVSYGCDNIVKIIGKRGKVTEITDWLKKYDGREVDLDLFVLNTEGVKNEKEKT